MPSFHKAFRMLMVGLGLFEFFSASQWYMNAHKEQSATTYYQLILLQQIISLRHGPRCALFKRISDHGLRG